MNTEAVVPEVVDVESTHTASPVPAVPDAADRANLAIEQAAHVALTMAAIPGKDEFLTLAMTARILSMSGAAPEAVRNNPYIAFHVALVGRDLDLSPSAALQLIDVISGSKGPQISLSPQLLNGRIERLGLGHIVKAASTADSCYAIAVGPGGDVDLRCRRSWPEHAEGCGCHGIIGDSEFTWEDARMAGLVGPSCQPGVHDPACLAWTKGKNCNQGYRTYPKRMLWWRAAGFCADDWFPTASMGFYSPEALGAVVDDEGRPVDPSTVTLPDGYEPEKPKPEAMAGEQFTGDLSARIHALPEEAMAALADRWRSTNDAGIAYLQPLARLPERQARKAAALVEHFEQRAQAGEWGDWTPPPAPPASPDPSGGDASDGAAVEVPEQPSAAAVEDGAPAAGGSPASPPAAAAPTTPAEAPTAAQEASGPCPVCNGTFVAADAPCWACTPSAACSLCDSTADARQVTGDGSVRCVDEDACWEREQAKRPAVPEPAEPAAAPIDDPNPGACELCGSTRSTLAHVPSPDGLPGVWRCSNASACKGRREGKSGVDVARAALGDKA